MLKRIIFEPTYRCNLKCQMCVPFPEGKYKYKEMDLDEVKKIFDKSLVLKQVGLIDISGGEPFVHKDIIGIITFLASKDYEVGITTNG